MISAAIGNIGYDSKGNTTSVGSKTYTYDMYNQLTSATGTGISATMDYDPVGRLSQITGAGVVTKFGYSGSQMITEYNSSDTVLRRYVHGVGSDEPIVWYEGAGTSVRKWMMTDQQGSITAITNSAGSVTNKNTYNEYGVPDTANTGRFQYTGQIWLAEAEVYHYKARAYDPYLGRFLQTDPIGYAAGMNMYAYVGGDPVNYRDPSGLEEDEIIVTGTRKKKRRQSVSFNFGGFGGFLFGVNTINLSGAYAGVEKAACTALLVAITTTGKKQIDKFINGAKLAGVDLSQGTFYGTVGGDITFRTGVGGDIGIYVRGDYSDFGFFTSVQANTGLDADVGFSLNYTTAQTLEGFSAVHEAGVGPVDVFGSGSALSHDNESYFGIGISASPLAGGGNFNAATATKTFSCVLNKES